MAIPKFKPLANTSEKTKNFLKPLLIGVGVLLLGTFGLEASNTDFDLGKLFGGSTLEESKVVRDDSGNILYDKEGNVVTSGGKYTDEYNCADFDTWEEAQKFFKNAGGPSKDVNRLDGNNDGEACESLPKQK